MLDNEAEDKILEWRNDPVKFFVEALGMNKDYIWHKMYEICDSILENRKVAIKAGHGVSKALDLDTIVYTDNGKKTIRDVKVGDKVINEEGEFVNVIDESPIFEDYTYELIFDDGNKVIAHAGHEWNIHDFLTRKKLRREGCIDYRDEWNSTKTVTTEWIYNNIQHNGQTNCSIPIVKSFNGKNNLDIAYTVGFWLGDGTTNFGSVSCCHTDSDEIMNRIESEGFIPKKHKNNLFGWQISGKERISGSLRKKLRDIGILNNKKFHENFLSLNFESKLALLQGYMDADGWKTQSNCAMVGTTSKLLHESFVPFLTSMGVKVFTSTEVIDYNGEEKVVYKTCFSPTFQPFYLDRKKLTSRDSQKQRHTCRYIVGCNKLSKRKVKCISVDSDKKLFGCTEHFIPTHNSYTMSRIVLWYLYTHYPSTIITTAPTHTQVEQILWREIRDAKNSALFKLPGKLTQTKLELEDKWFAFGFSTKPDQGQENATKMQGFHNENVMIVFDEACGIIKPIWEAKEGLLTNESAKFIAIGNPTMSSGDFIECFSDPTYHKITISVMDTPNYEKGYEVIPGLSGREFVDSIRAKYGEGSNQWKSRVLGEIPDANANSLLDRNWIISAENREYIESSENKRFVVWDVADGGDDLHVIKSFVNCNERECIVLREKKIEEAEPSVWRALRKIGGNTIVVDASGVGRVAAALLEQSADDGTEIIAFDGSDTKYVDTNVYFNMRSYAHWRMREMFEARELNLLPNNKDQEEELMSLALDDNDPKGLIKMLPKKIIKKILGHSPNYSDAIMMMCGTYNDIKECEVKKRYKNNSNLILPSFMAC